MQAQTRVLAALGGALVEHSHGLWASSLWSSFPRSCLPGKEDGVEDHGRPRCHNLLQGMFHTFQLMDSQCLVGDYMHLTQTVNMLQLGPAYMTFIAGVALYFAAYIAFA